jgi:hypothetical protein
MAQNTRYYRIVLMERTAPDSYESDLYDFIIKVDTLMDQGWEPLGAPAIDAETRTYLQVMIKPKQQARMGAGRKATE